MVHLDARMLGPLYVDDDAVFDERKSVELGRGPDRSPLSEPLFPGRFTGLDHRGVHQAHQPPLADLQRLVEASLRVADMPGIGHLHLCEEGLGLVGCPLVNEEHGGLAIEQAILSQPGDRPTTEDSAKVPKEDQRMATLGERVGEVHSIRGLERPGDLREVILFNRHLDAPWE